MKFRSLGNRLVTFVWLHLQVRHSAHVSVLGDDTHRNTANVVLLPHQITDG